MFSVLKFNQLNELYKYISSFNLLLVGDIQYISTINVINRIKVILFTGCKR